MMELSASSISNDVSKNSMVEDLSFYQACMDDANSQITDGLILESISNERISINDEFLGTYKVISDEIRGGMGSVWRVHHMNWNVDLAMKRPQPAFFAEASNARKEEFIKECERWIKLGLHPNIVSCYYVREIGGVPSIFSEWMDNGSLKEHIKNGTLYEDAEEEAEIRERLLDISIQAARGLNYSHENNLIHQDVKPGNLLLTKNWDAKVADFGLAKAISQISDKYEKTKASGYTREYCPAEQIKGAVPEKWMDVYAWALTVLEMYAGRRLWDTGEDARNRVDVYITDLRYQLPAGMQELITHCLNGRRSDFGKILTELEAIYLNEFGVKYTRPDLKTGDNADRLNNMALSFLDLGKPEEAVLCWEEALSKNPFHIQSVYNKSLFEWEKGVADDVDAIERVKAVEKQNPKGKGDFNTLLSRLESYRDILGFRIPQIEEFLDFKKEPSVLSSDGTFLYVSCIDPIKEYRGCTPVRKFRVRPWKLVWEQPTKTKFIADEMKHDHNNWGAALSSMKFSSKTAKLLKKNFVGSAIKDMAISPSDKYISFAGENGRLEIWETDNKVVLRTAEIISERELKTLKKRYGDILTEDFPSKLVFSDDSSTLSGLLYGKEFEWKFMTEGIKIFAAEKGYRKAGVETEYESDTLIYSHDMQTGFGVSGNGNNCIYYFREDRKKSLLWELSVIESYPAAVKREKEVQKLLQEGNNELSAGNIEKTIECISSLREYPDVPASTEFIELNRRLGSCCEIAGIHSLGVTEEMTPVYTSAAGTRVKLSDSFYDELYLDNEAVSAMALSTDESMVAVGSTKGRIFIITNNREQDIIRSFWCEWLNEDKEVIGLSFAGKDRYILSVEKDMHFDPGEERYASQNWVELRIFEIENKRTLKELKAWRKSLELHKSEALIEKVIDTDWSLKGCKITTENDFVFHLSDSNDLKGEKKVFAVTVDYDYHIRTESL